MRGGPTTYRIYLQPVAPAYTDASGEKIHTNLLIRRENKMNFTAR